MNRWNHRGKVGVGTNIGFVSLLMIFLTLCLTCFCVLALSIASKDSRLTERSLDYTQSYYQADELSQETLQKLDLGLSTIKQNINDPSQYYTQASVFLETLGQDARYEEADHTVTFTYSISEKSKLLQVIQINAPSEKTRYTVLSTHTISLPDDLSGQSQNLWKGN